MIPPATDAQRAAMPRWMHEVTALCIPHVVGLPVVDWLYCGIYGDLHGWIVTSVTPAVDSGPFVGMGQGIGTTNNKGSTCGAAGVYYIADMTRDLGHRHVARWCAAHGLPVPKVDSIAAGYACD